MRGVAPSARLGGRHASGVLALVVLNLIGINLWALRQRAEIEGRKEAMVALLKASHPQIGTIVDAPLQMRRATDTLRAAAGRVGDADFEAALAAAAVAWPDGQAPVHVAALRGRQAHAGGGRVGRRPDRALSRQLAVGRLERRGQPRAGLVLARAADAVRGSV